MSPYLFLLMSEGLSRALEDAKRRRIVLGIIVERDIAL